MLAARVKTTLTTSAAIGRSLQFERPVQSGNERLLRRCALRVRESAMSAMSEAEFDRLLEAVTMAVATVSPEDILATALVSHAPPEAANDNGLAWPLNPVS
jgi:hypothetical protein